MRLGLTALLCLTWEGCSFPDYRAPFDSSCSDHAPTCNQMAGTGGVAAGTGARGGADPGGSLAGAGGTAVVAPRELDGTYRLVAVHSSKCLDAPATRAGFTQAPCDGRDSESLTLTSVEAGFYALGVTGSVDCIAGGSTENGVALNRTRCSTELSQQWLPVKQDDGAYWLVNRSSNKCADVANGSKDDGTSIQEWVCNTGSNQRWVLASLIAEPLPIVVDDFFAPSIWGGNGTAPASVSPSGSDGNADCAGNRAPGGRGVCHVVRLLSFDKGATYAGASWLHPNGNWGYFPGLRLASGATKISFKARGEHGGEVIRFQSGGLKDTAFPDPFFVESKITLSDAWQSYSIDVSGVAYQAGVVTGFILYIDIAQNQAPLLFYVDDVVWE